MHLEKAENFPMLSFQSLGSRRFEVCGGNMAKIFGI